MCSFLHPPAVHCKWSSFGRHVCVFFFKKELIAFHHPYCHRFDFWCVVCPEAEAGTWPQRLAGVSQSQSVLVSVAESFWFVDGFLYFSVWSSPGLRFFMVYCCLLLQAARYLFRSMETVFMPEMDGSPLGISKNCAGVLGCSCRRLLKKDDSWKLELLMMWHRPVESP